MSDDAGSSNSALVARLLHGARWATLLRLCALAISWGSTLVVVRYLSVADYGLNAMLEAPLELLFLLSTLGLDLALTRARRVDPELVAPIFGWLLVINISLSGLYFFGSPLLAAYFQEPRLEPLARTIAIIFLLAPFRVIPNAMLDRELKFKLRASVELVCSVVAAMSTLVLAVLGFGVWALVSGVLVSRVLSAVLLMVLQPWFVRPTLNLTASRDLFAVGGLLTLASALGVTSNMFPVVIAGPALGPGALGLYAVALQFAMLPLSKVMPIVNSIAFPAFAKFEGQPAAIGHYVIRCLSVGALVLLPLMVGLACASQAFTVAVLGPRWAEAAVPLATLSLAMPFRGTSLFLREVLGGIGRADLKVACSLAPWVLGIPSLVLGVRFGISGLVGAFVLTEGLSCAFAWHLSRRVMALPWGKALHALRAPILSSMLLGGASLLPLLPPQDQDPFQALVLQVAAGSCAYMLALRLLFWSEAKTMLSLLRP